MSNTKPYVLLVGGRDHTFSRLAELEVEYSAFQFRSLLSDHLLDHAKTVHVFDYENDDLCLEMAKVLHADRNFDAVFSFAEYGFSAAAKISEALNIPSNCQSYTINCTRNKRAMREVMASSGMQSVPFKLVTTVDDVRDFVTEHGDSIVKPAEGGGSEGVLFINNIDDAESALNRANAVGRGEIVIEKYIPGNEYSVEAMSVDGVHKIAAITQKVTTGAPYFIECGHVQPAIISDELSAKISNEVVQLLDVIKMNTGPTHTELKVFEGNVYIIETQTRNGGDQIWELTLKTTGVDFFKETFSHVLNLSYDPVDVEAPAVAIKYLMIGNQAVNNLAGSDAAENIDGVDRLHLTDAVGKEFGEVNSAENRIGYVIAKGENSEKALETADKAIDAIEVS